MGIKRTLSQSEIDALFSSGAEGAGENVPVASFDFSRLDRIPKSQVRTVHLLHENFIRNLATSLGAYLRTHVSLNLISLEQISFGEFLEGLEPPTCITYVSLRPYDGTMLVELGRSLVFECVELLLGGATRDSEKPSRRLTNIEKNLAQNLLRIILADFRDAWSSVADIQFEVESLADEPHTLRVLTAAEAVVAVSIEVKMGTTTGMINMAIPSIFIKRLRDLFENVRSVQQVRTKLEDQIKVAGVLEHVELNLEVKVDHGSISPDQLATLAIGDVLTFDHAVDRPVSAVLNGHPTFTGRIGLDRGHLNFTVEQKDRV